MRSHPLFGLIVAIGVTGTAVAQPPAVANPSWSSLPAVSPPANLPPPVPPAQPSVAVVDGGAVIPSAAGWQDTTAPGFRPNTLPSGIIAQEQTPSAPLQTLPTVVPPVANPVPSLPPQALPCPSIEDPCSPSAAILCPPACAPAGRTWVDVEWLYWAASGSYLPPLVTTSPIGTAGAVIGGLPNPNTGVLFGENRANNGFRNGFRLTGGLWLTDDNRFGIEGDFFFLTPSQTGYSAASNGGEILARPFVNALTGRPDSELVAFPGTLAGTIKVDSRSNLIGAGVNAVHNLCCAPRGRLDLLYGYRYFSLTDDLTIGDNSISLAGNGVMPGGTQFQVLDRFRTANSFNGGLLGLGGEHRFGRLFVGGKASVAFGANDESVDVFGVTTVTPPGGSAAAYPGGLLAQASNMGHHHQSVFAVMPEVGFRCGIQLTRWSRVYAGYNFIYLNNVVRAPEQVNAVVNPTLLAPRTSVVGPAFPAFLPQTSDFWVQGISLGMELRF